MENKHEEKNTMLLHSNGYGEYAHYSVWSLLWGIPAGVLLGFIIFFYYLFPIQLLWLVPGILFSIPYIIFTLSDQD